MRQFRLSAGLRLLTDVDNSAYDHCVDRVDRGMELLLTCEQGNHQLLIEMTSSQLEVERSSAHLSALEAITDPALSQLGIASLIEQVLTRACEALTADAVALHLLSDDGRRLSLRALHGARGGARPSGEISLGEGVIGRVASTGRPATIENLVDDESRDGVGRRFRSIVAVPLRARTRVMGVLHASTEKPHRFDLADVTLMATAADRLACAVDRTRLYDAEQRARAVAADALKARDDFLAMASHELKTPMTSLVLLVECLARSALKTSNGDLLPKLESIEHQVLRLAELTESLLDASRMNASGVGLHLGAVDLGAVAREAVARVTEEFPDPRAPVSLHVEAPVIGRWDRRRCEQMVTHLLSNAASYGEHHPIEVDVTGDGETARIVVRDHGMGIAAQHHQRIFNLYARAGATQNIAGLGIGLWVVRRIARALGGHVSVKSKPGEGAAFTVELPIRGPAGAEDPHAPTP